MKFILTLENSSKERKQLTWELLENPLVTRWINLMNSNRASTFHSQWDWWAIGYSQQHLNSVWDEIQSLVKIINEKVCAGILDETISKCSRQNLNTLHQRFHLLAEHNNPSKEIHRLNYLVHIAENCIGNLSAKTDFGFMVSRFNNYAVEPLTTDDYQYFNTYIIQPGELSLSYSTIGKNLRNCAQDNDLEIIKQGMVRPKITLTTEVHAVFGTASKNPESGNIEKNRYFKWCDDNNVESYGYNCRDPIHTGGYCIIGNALDINQLAFTDWVINSVDVQVVNWQII